VIYKSLGVSSEQVSAIGQGTMGLGGYFSRDESNDTEWICLIRLGIDLGMTFIDTAEVYGAGHTEELIGSAVRGIRQRAFIATKFSPEHSAYEEVIHAVEASLKRLNTDYIDLLQTHWRNYRVPLEDTMRAMKKLVECGKVRYIGVSNFSVDEMTEVQEYLGETPIVSSQQEYNLLDRSVEENILPYCKEQRITLIAYSPFLQGKLASQHNKKAKLAEIAVNYGVSVGQLILKWLALNESVIAIPKAASEKHLRENATALDFHLQTADVRKISELFPTQVEFVPANAIKVADDSHRNVYRTLDEAVQNRFNLNPSPDEMAQRFCAGETFKPIKVQGDPSETMKKKYLLIEGRVKYWGWVIAFGQDRPIPVLVMD